MKTYLFKIFTIMLLIGSTFSYADDIELKYKEIKFADTLTKAVSIISKDLIATLRISKKQIGPIAITSFVQLSQLNKTTHFGRVLGESFFSILHLYGLDTMDFRGQKGLSVNLDGEFFITRDVKKLSHSVINKYVLVGTFTNADNAILINARIIDNINGKVISASSVMYNSNDCKLFENCPKPKTPRTINIVTGD